MVLSGGGCPDGDSRKFGGANRCQDRNAGEPTHTGVVAIEIELAGGRNGELPSMAGFELDGQARARAECHSTGWRL